MEKNNKKGVTLLETVIAMALVVIISFATYSTCNFAIKHKQSSNIKNFFVQETENIAMCYYKTNSNNSTAFDDFENALIFTFEINNADEFFEYNTSTSADGDIIINRLTIYYSSSLKYLKLTNKNDAKYKVVFIFDTSGNIIKSINLSNDKTIFEKEV